MNGACGWFCGTFYTKSSRRLRKTKKTILPPQAVPLPLQGRLNVSLRNSTHLNYLSQNVTFSHLLFGRVSSGRKTIFLDTVYSLFTIHYSPFTYSLRYGLFTFHFSLFTKSSWFYLFASRHPKIQLYTFINM